MDFVAIDVETANAKMSSICQIGMARYSGGVLIQEWKSYINPEDHFDGINVSIHGIDEAKVADAPTFKAVAGILKEYLENRVAVSHMPFDRVAISQASRGGLGCLNRISASISGASAGVRLPSGGAAA